MEVGRLGKFPYHCQGMMKVYLSFLRLLDEISRLVCLIAHGAGLQFIKDRVQF